MADGTVLAQLLAQGAERGADLVTLASILRIPVDMHNLPDEALFRPAAWHRFGSGLDPVGADFRACQAYGPLYR